MILCAVRLSSKYAENTVGVQSISIWSGYSNKAMNSSYDILKLLEGTCVSRMANVEISQ